jgi:3-oxosteroid 1-dehydrogenase
MDERFRQSYPFGTALPGRTPEPLLREGYFSKASTLDELAARLDIDAAGLQETVQRFNQFAQEGHDLDFHRGENAYDRYYGDPTVKPNPCLAPLTKPPFYAVKMWPGDLGTKGGLVTDERARVLRSDGTPIAGLYAAGNTTASVMGHLYPGPGATIGPAMTFGYIAALDAVMTAGDDSAIPVASRSSTLD